MATMFEQMAVFARDRRPAVFVIAHYDAGQALSELERNPAIAAMQLGSLDRVRCMGVPIAVANVERSFFITDDQWGQPTLHMIPWD